MLNRVTRHDGGGEVMLREAGDAGGDGITRSAGLPAGVYQLEVEVSGDGPASRAQQDAVKRLRASRRRIRRRRGKRIRSSIPK